MKNKLAASYKRQYPGLSREILACDDSSGTEGRQSLHGRKETTSSRFI